MSWWKKQKARLDTLIAEYGVTAFVVWWVVFGVTVVGFAALFRAGVDLSAFGVSESAGTLSLLGAGYVASQVVKPVRIGVVIVLTPLVANAWRRFRGTAPASVEPSEAAPTTSPESAAVSPPHDAA